MLAPTPYFADRGCHVRIYEQAKALQSLGVDVRIVTYHLGRDMPDIPTYRICHIPWYKKLTAGPSWHKPYLDLLLLFKAAGVARSFSPDLIHAHLHEGALVGYPLKKWLGIPMIFDYQGSLTAEIEAHGFVKDRSLLHKLFTSLEKIINGFADILMTSSGSSASNLVGHWHVPPHRVHPLIDGVDTAIFFPSGKDQCRQSLQLPPQLPLVGFLGLLNQYQGIDLLLEAAVMLKNSGRPVHFLIMGFPAEEYMKKAGALGVDHLVTFTGRIDYADAPKYLSACDLAVSPKISLSEANGKLFNYMACGLPTVVFETAINREILGDTGIYARFGDPADLAAKILLVLGDEALRAELSRKVREKAEGEHSWQARGQDLLGIYQRLLDR